MSLVEPMAVAHSPTLRPAGVSLSNLEYFVEEVTVTVLGPVLVDVVLPEKLKLSACTVIVEPDTDVTLPEAVAKLAGRVTVVRGRELDVRLGKVPAVLPGKRPPGPLKTPRPRPQLPLAEGEIVTVVASTAPPGPFVPTAVMHTPAVTSLTLADTVAVMSVLEVRSTVVWPVSVFCTSSVSPEMLAIFPKAAGAKADVPPAPPAPPAPLAPPAPEPPLPLVAAAVVAVVPVAEALFPPVPPPPPHAAATNETAAKTPAVNVGRRVLPDSNSRWVKGSFFLSR
jgi:hypothetical protein